MNDHCCPCGVRLDRSAAVRPLNSPCLRMFMSIRTMKSITCDMKVCNICRHLYNKWKNENSEFSAILNRLENEISKCNDNDDNLTNDMAKYNDNDDNLVNDMVKYNDDDDRLVNFILFSFILF